MKALFLFLALACIDCHPAPVPAVVTSDFAAALACVIANFNNPLVCVGYTVAEIAAIVEWLLADPKFAAAHPEAIAPLKLHLKELRLKEARP